MSFKTLTTHETIEYDITASIPSSITINDTIYQLEVTRMSQLLMSKNNHSLSIVVSIDVFTGKLDDNNYVYTIDIYLLHDTHGSMIAGIDMADVNAEDKQIKAFIFNNQHLFTLTLE